MMKELLTRKKLAEAKYFQSKLVETQNDDEFYFNLSAFLNSWRSILNVMLYDFNDNYSLGFSREDYMNDKEFKDVATALKKTNALKFIQWWKQKQGRLEKNPLWNKRNISFHRGYPKMSEYRIFVAASRGISDTTSVIPYKKRISYSSTSTPLQRDPANYYFSDIQDRTVIQCCDEILKEIERIIIEAEKTFSIQL